MFFLGILAQAPVLMESEPGFGLSLNRVCLTRNGTRFI
jgi:hypothetical protein